MNNETKGNYWLKTWNNICCRMAMQQQGSNCFSTIFAMRLGFLWVVLFGITHSATAQTTTLPTTPYKDTAQSKTNTGAWKDVDATIYYEQMHNPAHLQLDTELHTFQRRPFVRQWARDLGNPGSPMNNLLFTPQQYVGPALGYNIFDPYRFHLDSLKFFNTTRPYSEFSYNLGSKLEQVAGVMHTQNIKPNWNFMVQYRKINAPGFYKTQRNNHDNFCVSTTYKSLQQHYKLYAGMVYNKEQHDENGGIVRDTNLTDPAYIDRRTIDAAYQNSQYSLTRSPVSNVYRDFGMVLKQGYTWGANDTTYSTDSTQYTWQLIPRFSVTHKMQLATHKHTYRDLTPDSNRYAPFFNASFPQSGNEYYIQGADSVFTRQKWFYVDNTVLLNGFVGKGARLLEFSAGVGNRYDHFISDPSYLKATDDRTAISNYVLGTLQKNGTDSTNWTYNAALKLFVTGSYAGNFDGSAFVSRAISKGKAKFAAAFHQSLGSAAYSYTDYQNAWTANQYSFNQQSVTQAEASVTLNTIRLAAGLRSILAKNYIYINEQQVPTQYTLPFSTNTFWLCKTFKLGNFYIDNEWVYQPTGNNIPINVPELMGRHQFSYDRPAFKGKLKLATGFEVRYNTAYYPAAYSAVLNRFYYQHTSYIANTPELSVFFNFRVRHFRAFLMIDQLQQTFARNTILFRAAPVSNFLGDGQVHNAVYATQNTMIRFGFNWVLIN